MKKIAYLGPAGTFTEQALLSEKDLAEMKLIEYPRFSEILKAVEDKTCDLGFVAIENAIEGPVNITLDALAFDFNLMIQREVELPIVLNLTAQKGTTLEDIDTVMSHPVAIAQCRDFIEKKIPHAVTKPANSTSAAALQATQNPKIAALAPKIAADKYGLNILAENIADQENNKTRFVLVGKNYIPKPTGHDKTSVVMTQKEDRPGSLIAILQEFAAREINLTRLNSRPIKKEKLGNYCFITDFDGHIADEVVADCLKSIQANHAEVKFLGSYPSCNISSEKQKHKNQSYQKAESWINQLSEYIDSNNQSHD